MSNIKPRNGYLLVEPLNMKNKPEDTGGLILDDDVVEGPPSGTVLAVDKDIEIQENYRAGDIVLFKEEGAIKTSEGNLLVHYEKILATENS